MKRTRITLNEKHIFVPVLKKKYLPLPILFIAQLTYLRPSTHYNPPLHNAQTRLREKGQFSLTKLFRLSSIRIRVEIRTGILAFTICISATNSTPHLLIKERHRKCKYRSAERPHVRHGRVVVLFFANSFLRRPTADTMNYSGCVSSCSPGFFQLLLRRQHIKRA